jgi:uncharacterized membrane protein
MENRGNEAAQPHAAPAAVEENVEAISAWEQAALHSRSGAERLGDWITATAASGPVLLAHVAWFAIWAVINTGLLPGVKPFDRFPFPFLTMTVSLEAIFLALFVLASQNRLAKQSDKRAHLDLQIDLLAEREMTAVLRLLLDIAAHLKVPDTVTPDQIRDLVKRTDIHELTAKLDELDETAESPSGGQASGDPR